MTRPRSGFHLAPEHKAKIGNANRGRVHTAEARANMGKGQRGRVQTPEHIEKRAKANRGRKHSAETIAKLSEARRKRQITPEAKLKISLTNKRKGIKPPSRKGARHTPEWKAIMAIKSKGKKHTKESKLKISQANKGRHRTPETRAKLAAISTGKSPSLETRKKLSAINKGKHLSEEQKAKLRQPWTNPEYKARRLRQLAIAQGHKQTKGEKAVEDIANYLLPNTYKYVGSGEDVVVINGLKPDFIHANGQKKIIEFFGDYIHSFAKTRRTREEEELYRMNKYRKVGYDCLIIWGKELKESPDSVAKRILAFHASRPKQTEAQPCLL